jgi:hypothetical protein
MLVVSSMGGSVVLVVVVVVVVEVVLVVANTSTATVTGALCELEAEHPLRTVTPHTPKRRLVWNFSILFTEVRLRSQV